MSTVQQSTSQSSSPDVLAQFALLILALMGFFSVLIAMRWGAGTSPDSVIYIAGAHNLAAGNGFNTISESGEVQAITHHAPFYSVLLAALNLIGLDLLQGARWLNALLFAGNILLVGFLILGLVDNSQTIEARLAPVIAAGLILCPVFLVEIYSMAWSEALFIFLTLSGFWALSRFLYNYASGYLVGSAILIALAFLTRYIGAVVVATGCASILLFSTRPLRRRLVDTLVFGFISAGPMVLWLLHNSLSGGTATNRELLFHPINRQQIGLAISTLGSWVLIPETNSAAIKMLPFLAIGLLIAAVMFWKQKRSPRGKTWTSWVTLSELPVLIRIILIFVPLYLAFLLVSLTFLDANTPLDSRILSPVYVAGVILVVYFLTEGLKWLNKLAIVRFALIGLVFVFVAALVPTTTNYVLDGYADGIGFTSRWWRESPTLAALRNFPPNEVVYTNAPEALYLYTQREARSMPKKFESANQRPNQNYDLELIELKEQLQDQGGIIVYFDPMLRPTLPSAQEIQDVLGLKVLEETADGVIYGIKEQNSTDLWQPSV